MQLASSTVKSLGFSWAWQGHTLGWTFIPAAAMAQEGGVWLVDSSSFHTWLDAHIYCNHAFAPGAQSRKVSIATFSLVGCTPLVPIIPWCLFTPHSTLFSTHMFGWCLLSSSPSWRVFMRCAADRLITNGGAGAGCLQCKIFCSVVVVAYAYAVCFCIGPPSIMRQCRVLGTAQGELR